MREESCILESSLSLIRRNSVLEELLTIIMVHKGTSSSYRSVGYIGL